MDMQSYLTADYEAGLRDAPMIIRVEDVMVIIPQVDHYCDFCGGRGYVSQGYTGVVDGAGDVPCKYCAPIDGELPY